MGVIFFETLNYSKKNRYYLMLLKQLTEQNKNS
jgi:hypothetical protein